MSKEVIQSFLVFAIGIIAVVTVVASWILMFPNAPASFTHVVYAGVYLFLGLTVGLFWRNKSIYGAFWLALPLVLLGVFSILFAGFISKFVSDDLPRLATVFVAGTFGCYLGQRISSHRANESLD